VARQRGEFPGASESLFTLATNTIPLRLQEFDQSYNSAVSGYFGSPRENLERHGVHNETENPDSFFLDDLCTGAVFVGDDNSSFAQDACCRGSSGSGSPASGRARGIA
jgi:hypothetical protein